MAENTNTERDRAIMEGERNASLEAYKRGAWPCTAPMERSYEAGFTNGWEHRASLSLPAAGQEPVALEPRYLRKFLQALQAGEMSVSRAVEILEAWVGGHYEDSMVPPPPADSCLIADDEFPMEIVRKLRAELAAAPPPAVTAGAVDALRTAAQAVVDRWDTPLWKDAPATAEYIGMLRAALAAQRGGA